MAKKLNQWLADWGPALPLLVVAFCLLIAPVIALLVESFRADDGGFTLTHWLAVLGGKSGQRAIVTSLEVSVVENLVATMQALFLLLGSLLAHRKILILVLPVNQRLTRLPLPPRGGGQAGNHPQRRDRQRYLVYLRVATVLLLAAAVAQNLLTH